MNAARELESYTVEDIYALPDGMRAELIDGQIYYMAPPSRTHQKISWRLHQIIGNYIDSKGGQCEVYAAPFAVFLSEDDINYCIYFFFCTCLCHIFLLSPMPYYIVPNR